MERWHPELELHWQSVNAATKHAHTTDDETSQRSALCCTITRIPGTPRERRGIRPTVWESCLASPSSSIHHAFHSSESHWHITRRSLEYMFFRLFRGSFQATGTRSVIAVILSPQSRRREEHSVIAQNRSSSA